MNRVPNVIELGRRPVPLRYSWIATNGQGEIRQGSTWITLKRALEEMEEVTIRVVDLHRNRVFVLKDPESFLNKWRPQYFNYDWNC